jgi:MoaA/NifB/PqqE/SkfB family radical SAM enzyme
MNIEKNLGKQFENAETEISPKEREEVFRQDENELRHATGECAGIESKHSIDPLRDSDKELKQEHEHPGLYEKTDAKVYVTYACSAACKHCATDWRGHTKELGTAEDTEIREKEIKEYLDKFKEAMRLYHEGGGRTILFTGGEPTEYPEKFFGMLKVLQDLKKSEGIDWNVLATYTNGVEWLKEVEYEGERKRVIDFLKELELKSVDLSAHHYDQKKRGELSKSMGEVDVEKLVAELQQSNFQVRFQGTLNKDLIGSADDVSKYVKWVTAMGGQDIYLRNMFKVGKIGPDTTPGDQQKLRYALERAVDLEQIVTELQKNPDFEFIGTSERHSGYGTTYKFKYRPTGASVQLGDLTIGAEDPEKNTYFTFNPDGNVTRNMNIGGRKDFSEKSQHGAKTAQRLKK